MILQLATHLASNGLTLLDYYICHAPAEAWNHFEPQMREKPDPVWYVVVDKHRLEFKTRQDAEEFSWSSTFDGGEGVCADRTEEEAWGVEYVEQRVRQWPIYWALLMLEQREKALS